MPEDRPCTSIVVLSPSSLPYYCPFLFHQQRQGHFHHMQQGLHSFLQSNFSHLLNLPHLLALLLGYAKHIQLADYAKDLVSFKT